MMHATGDCNPYECRHCDWMLANQREDHENKSCGGYAHCSICEDEHDCDTSVEPTCPSCRVAV